MGNIISKNINTEQIITIKSSIPLFLDNLKSICEINMGIELGAKILNGFLLKFYIDQEIFYCLICNINNSNYDIINNNIINLYYDNKKKNVIIKIEKNRRYFKNFIDLFVIEILEEDEIPNNYFLYTDIFNLKINDNLINSPIYIPHNEGKKFLKAEGLIKEINKYEFIHSIQTKNELLGYPILSESNVKVIGINKKENSANFIYIQ